MRRQRALLSGDNCFDFSTAILTVKKTKNKKETEM